MTLSDSFATLRPHIDEATASSLARLLVRAGASSRSEEEVKNFDYDMLVFFSPTGVKALKENIPGFEQGDIKIAAFGPATAREVEAQGLKLDLQAPSKEYPSMTGALRAYLEKQKKK